MTTPTKTTVRIVDLIGADPTYGIQSMLRAVNDSGIVFLAETGPVIINSEGDSVIQKPFEPETMVGLLSSIGTTCKQVFDAKTSTFSSQASAATPAQCKIALSYYDRAKFLRKLRFIAKTSVMAEDGLDIKLNHKGWANGIYVHTDAKLPYVSVGDAPGIVLDVFKGCRFNTISDASRAIAAMITPAIRQLYPEMQAPIHIYAAVGPGAGKGYISSLTTAVYREKQTILPIDGSPGKASDAFIGALAMGDRYICLDNVKVANETSLIEAALTAKTITGRAAFLPNAKFSMACVHVTMTANEGLRITPDMLARASVITIAARSATETGGGILKNEMLDPLVSDKTLAAIYAIITHWHYAGRKLGKVTHRFTEWSQIVNHIVSEYFGLPTTDVGADKSRDELALPEELKFLARMGRYICDEHKVKEYGALTSEICQAMDDLSDHPFKLVGNPERALSHALREQISELQDKAITVDGVRMERGRVKRPNGNYVQGWKFELIERVANMSSSDITVLARDLVNAASARLKPGYIAPLEFKPAEKAIAKVEESTKLEKSMFTRKARGPRTPEQLEAAKARKEQAEKPQGADIDNF